MDNLRPTDIAIIIGYLVVIVAAGVVLSRRASRNLNSYFLGGRSIPWYLLAVSNASGMFDVAGTMWMVTLLFIYGVKSIWIPWLWPSFNQVFLMVYLAVWLRRSGVLTGAEWIRTRFGDRLGGEMAHISVVIFALVSVFGFLAYAFQAVGKFAVIFLPWKFTANEYAVILMSITTFYVILGGMYSVVLTDIIQFLILTVASVAVAAIALIRTSPESIAAAVPDGWSSLFFGRNLNLDWSRLIPAVNDKISNDGFSLFGLFFMMMVFKGFLSSMAGPAPNYDMQRILATRNPRESALMSFFVSVVLFFPRYLLIAGIAVLALVFFSTPLASMGPEVDFEQILPYVVQNYVPVGLKGLLIAGLLAAFMSTFDSTVNAGAAYLVNDVCKRYIVPNATSRTYVAIGYLCSVIIVLVGMYFGMLGKDIHNIIKWITIGLGAGYISANVLKWHWWRFNGFGYFAGMITGIVTAALVEMRFAEWCPQLAGRLEDATNGFPPVLALFPLVLLVSSFASILVSLLTPPTDDQVLKSFYSNVRPWGLWHPIHLKVLRTSPTFHTHSTFSRDVINVIVGIVWQTTFAVMPVCIIIRQYKLLWISLATLIVTSVFLKANWYNKLARD